MDKILEALKAYGASLNNDGVITKGDKVTGVKVSIKGQRIRFTNDENRLIMSGPVTCSTVVSFVEDFWFWKAV